MNWRVIAAAVAVVALSGCVNPFSDEPDGTTHSFDTHSFLSAPLLTGVTPAPDSVAVTWHDTTDDQPAFLVERATSSSFQPYRSYDVPAGQTTWTDDSVVQGATYYYRVRAVGDGVSSPASGIAGVTVPTETGTTYPVPVVEHTTASTLSVRATDGTTLATIAAGEELTVAWDAPAGGAVVAHYNVYQKRVGTVDWVHHSQVSAVGDLTVSITVASFAAPATYEIGVSAVDTVGTESEIHGSLDSTAQLGGWLIETAE